MTFVVGVDGCRAGWVLARLSGAGDVAVRVVPALADALEAGPEAVAVDIPIGVPDEPVPGGRVCDRMARRILGPRRASVFTPPPRRALAARSYDEVRGLGVSLQAFHLLPRIREADALVTPPLQRIVREAHPELAFTRLLGTPPAASKRTPEGRAERVRTLDESRVLRVPVELLLRDALARWPRRALGADDVLDALALAVTARRLARGEARVLPEDPPRDSRGLRMEIVD